MGNALGMMERLLVLHFADFLRKQEKCTSVECGYDEIAALFSFLIYLDYSCSHGLTANGN
jgi:hypothetical protein